MPFSNSVPPKDPEEYRGIADEEAVREELAQQFGTPCPNHSKLGDHIYGALTNCRCCSATCCKSECQHKFTECIKLHRNPLRNVNTGSSPKDEKNQTKETRRKRRQRKQKQKARTELLHGDNDVSKQMVDNLLNASEGTDALEHGSTPTVSVMSAPGSSEEYVSGRASDSCDNINSQDLRDVGGSRDETITEPDVPTTEFEEKADEVERGNYKTLVDVVNILPRFHVSSEDAARISAKVLSDVDRIAKSTVSDVLRELSAAMKRLQTTDSSCFSISINDCCGGGSDAHSRCLALTLEALTNVDLSHWSKGPILGT